MTGSCSHTELMNIMICLGIKNSAIDPVLINKGYPLDSIGGKILTRTGSEVRPDLSFMSIADKGYLLIDCKSGTLEKAQSVAYKDIDIASLKEAYKSSVAGDSAINISWICSEGNLGKVKQKNKEWNISFPILCKSDDNFLIKYNNFSISTLENIFSKKIELPKIIPNYFYPFSQDDSDEEILILLFASMVELCANPLNTDKKFTVEELLIKSHPCYEYFDITEKKDIKGRVGHLISDLSRNELKNHVRSYPGETNCWQLFSGLFKFRNVCVQLIKEYHKILERKKDQSKQKKIMDYT